jgi:glycosyltransferase involved in cell wall biosynthesis
VSSVDIVVPCYNYGRYLKRCVGSVLEQPGVTVRALIIDDASQDDSAEIGRELTALDDRVQFIKHTKNCGHIATYNEGLLEWAAADYSLLLSADDALTPGALRRAVELMDAHPEVGMVYGMALVLRDGDHMLETFMAQPADYRILSSVEFLQRCFKIGNTIETPTAVVRTRLQRQAGGYRAELPHSGDMEMWMRLAAHGPVGVLRALQGYVYRHGANMRLKYFKQLLGDRREVLRACEHVLEQFGERFPEYQEGWRRAMRLRLAKESCELAAAAFENGEFDNYEACLEFAQKLSSSIYSSREWWRLKARTALGGGPWRSVRSMRRKVRPQRLPEITERGSWESGWWPG